VQNIRNTKRRDHVNCQGNVHKKIGRALAFFCASAFTFLSPKWYQSVSDRGQLRNYQSVPVANATRTNMPMPGVGKHFLLRVTFKMLLLSGAAYILCLQFTMYENSSFMVI